MKKLLVLSIVLLSCLSIALASEPAVEVAAIATSVENLIPIGVSEKFPSAVGRLYCYSKIVGAEGKNIKHVWYLNEKKVREIAIPIMSKSYRTYTLLTLGKETKGKGRVDITTEDGKVLKSVDFALE